MKQNKKEKQINTKTKQNNKTKTILPITLVVLVILGVVVFAFSNNKNLEMATVNEETTKAETKAIVLEDNNYMHVETDASGDKVPVPNGFVGSTAIGENEIDTGYVIYALKEGETKETVEINDKNKDTAQKERNQYVWVPVPDPSKFYGTDANGKKWGKNYTFSTSTSSSYDQVTGTRPNNWSETNGVMSISSITGYREPDVVVKNSSGTTGYDMDSRLRTLGLGAETTHEFLFQLEKEFNKMIDSVEKYGGFYIGRYETGNLSQDQAVVRKGNTDINYATWYSAYKKCKELEPENTNVTTGLIWGNQRDRTLMWLMECNADNPETGKTKAEVISDSTSWGNYIKSTFEYVNSSGNTVTKNGSTIIPTGSTDYTKANNIYDLAGNMFELTMVAYSSNVRPLYGGGYNFNGDSSASYRLSSYDPNVSTQITGNRAILYIK